ncbi:hypothetical protein AT01_715 [Yersinia aldovae 670-83]|nr:hypothetical protein AT01_715 [Yersinia aldovae 670-83]
MSAIDITTMRGEMPRTVPHLLPEQAATVAKNCHFRHGVITPIMADVDGVKTFSLKPTTIFRYRDDYWFAWTDLVDAIRSPVAQDKYERVYFTDGKYPKVTSNEITTQGLITTLVKRKSIPILTIPRGSGQNKLIRCLNTIPQMKTGCVYLPALMTDD